ncbi:hypothetical protein [Microvirga sp. M2]|uniref:hypothetical protein n=1 Tax=Microvirga sp. M2 TaxID=3073270 RepID=UPI0039C1B817
MIRTNGDILQALLVGFEALPDTPSFVLADWVATIPDEAVYGQARHALLARFPRLNRAPEQIKLDDADQEHTRWLARPFMPPVYSTDAQTGERRLIPQEFIEALGLDSNAPQRVYTMPEGLDGDDVMKWLLREPPYDDKEKHATWMDWDGTEYDLIDSQYVPRSTQER